MALLLSLLAGPAAAAEAPVCYGPEYGPTTRTPIDRSFWDCAASDDPCCLDAAYGDVDEDGDTVPARCDPDDTNDDDDGDGLPTAREDLDGDGWLFDDTDKRSPTGVATPAFLDPASPLDDDGDGACDCAWASLATSPPGCTSGDDCMDFLASGYAGAPEVWDAELWDHDCGGPNDLDLDGDGYLASAHADTGLDCDDLDPAVNPEAVEDDGERDLDCDGFFDPSNPLVPRGGCGCASVASPPTIAPMLALLAPLLRRRRR